ncbi:hypothetical protein BDQ17DRAFT_1331981 [Cyathus striatus]|nr:hypothetical protein BDQ17DRAFT_1331981 [Cyathus striatus]
MSGADCCELCCCCFSCFTICGQSDMCRLCATYYAEKQPNRRGSYERQEGMREFAAINHNSAPWVEQMLKKLMSAHSRIYSAIAFEAVMNDTHRLLIDYTLV